MATDNNATGSFTSKSHIEHQDDISIKTADRQQNFRELEKLLGKNSTINYYIHSFEQCEDMIQIKHNGGELALKTANNNTDPAIASCKSLAIA